MSDTNYEYLKYEPAPRKPEGFDERWLAAVGLSPNGVDPNVRWVWAMDRTEKIGKKLIHRYPDPDDKYVALPFWILEGYQSPGVFNEAEWKLQEEYLGEFPRSGVWDFIEVYRTPDYQFLPLDDNAFAKAAEWKFWRSKTKPRVVADLLERRERLAELKETRWERKKQEIYEDFSEKFDRAAANAPLAPEFSKNIMTKKPEKGFKQTASGLFVPNGH